MFSYITFVNILDRVGLSSFLSSSAMLNDSGKVSIGKLKGIGNSILGVEWENTVCTAGSSNTISPVGASTDCETSAVGETSADGETSTNSDICIVGNTYIDGGTSNGSGTSSIVNGASNGVAESDVSIVL